MMCTTLNPQMLRSGALNPSGGRGTYTGGPRWSPDSESSETRYRTGKGYQGGYKRLDKKPAPFPSKPKRTPQVNNGDPGAPTVEEWKSNPNKYSGDPHTPTVKEWKSNLKYSGDPYAPMGVRAKTQRDPYATTGARTKAQRARGRNRS